MKTRVVVLAVVGVLGVAAVAIAGTLGYQMFFGSSEDDALALVPVDAVAYGNIFLDPSMDQKRAIEDLLEKFPEAPNADEARNEFVDLLDEGLAEIDMNFDDDIDPWLGNQIAGWAEIPDDLGGAGESPLAGGDSPPAAFMIASDDDEAAIQFVEEASANSDEEITDESYEGADYVLNEAESSAAGVVDGFLVIGTEEGFKAVVDVSGGEDSLADSETYTDATDELTEDRLASFYFDGAALAEALEESGAPEGGMDFENLGFGGSFSPTAGALFAESDKVVFESTSTPGEDAEAPEISDGLLPDVPGDSWGAFGIPDLGATLEKLYDGVTEALAEGGMGNPQELDDQFEAQTGLNLREDLLSWMGDAGLFVAGTDPMEVSGGLVIESTDPATSSATVDQLAALLQQQGIQTEPLSAGGAEGFAVEIPVPGVTERAVVLAGDRVVIAYGEDAAVTALESSDPLSESEAFQTATEGLGDDFTAAGYFDVDAMQELAEAAGAGQFPEYEEEVKPWLEPFTYVTFGSREDGGRLVQRLVIGIE
ncbi:MAG TPA: DUF3352 domain-containing protein [Actinomycetota bacterium]|nr:DUF3352 domain-containing protein [Actinomycetota bacterium]